MAFNTNTPRVSYIAAAGQTVFPFTFKIFTNTNLTVYKNSIALVLSTNYTVTINGDSGGEVTLLVGASLSDEIVIVRSLPITREFDYQDNGDFFADTVDNDQDYQTYLVQDVDAKFDRTFTLPDSISGTVNSELPFPINDAYIRWNSDSTAIINDTTIPSAVLLAKDWANKAEDSVVADGEYSAKHYSLKAKDEKLEALTSASHALGYRNEAKVFRDEAELFNLSKAFVVGTIEELVTIPSSYTTAIVKDLDRGGTFVWSATGTANGGTVFAGATGYWNRQYSGAVNVKWFGAKDGENITNSLQTALNTASEIVIDTNNSILSTVYLTRNTILLGNRTLLTIGVGTNTNGIVSNGYDLYVRGIDFNSPRIAGVFTQALTLANVQNISIKDSSFNNFSQFSVAISYNIAGTYNKIIVDNIAVTNAGNTENGINNCFEIIHRDYDCISRLISITNSTFTTIDGTGGNILKAGVGLVTTIKNCIFTTTNRTGLSGSPSVELSNTGNALAVQSKYYIENCKFFDDSISYYTLGFSRGSVAINSCEIGGKGVYLSNPIVQNIEISNTVFDRFLVEATSTSTVNNITIRDMSILNYILIKSSFLTVQTMVINNSIISKQVDTRNSLISVLDIAYNKFYISTVEHYISAVSSISFTNNTAFEKNDITAQSNAFIFYGCTALVSKNIISLGSNRTYYISYGTASSVRAVDNVYEKSNSTIYGNIGGTYTSYNNILNGNFSDISTKLKLYGTAIPAVGTYVVGDKVYNTSTNAGGYIGWVCVTAGTPGTWKGFGLIQA